MTNKPEMKSVTSSMVDAIGFDDVHEVLYVEFKGGKVYTYEGVKAHTWHAMNVEGVSVGQFINKTIKPNYPSTKIEG